MVFSPFSAVLGLLVLVPIGSFLGFVFGGQLGGVAGFVLMLTLSIVGSFKAKK